MHITYLGHSAFEIQTTGAKILLDPFLVLSPDYDTSGVTHIFLSHGHGDHMGSAIDIAQKEGATILAVHELSGYCAKQGVKSIGMNVGGWVKFDFGRVMAVPAFHSSSTPDGVYAGCPVGYVIEIEDQRIYFAGDTSLSAEMKVIGEVMPPDIALLPVGGHYTMGIDHAVIASQWLHAKCVVPMHYNTFEAITVDIQEFAHKLQALRIEPKVLAVGEGF